MGSVAWDNLVKRERRIRHAIVEVWLVLGYVKAVASGPNRVRFVDVLSALEVTAGCIIVVGYRNHDAIAFTPEVERFTVGRLDFKNLIRIVRNLNIRIDRRCKVVADIRICTEAG